MFDLSVDAPHGGGAPRCLECEVVRWHRRGVMSTRTIVRPRADVTSTGISPRGYCTSRGPWTPEPGERYARGIVIAPGGLHVSWHDDIVGVPSCSASPLFSASVPYPDYLGK